MKTMIESYRQKWQQLNSRERQLITLMTVIMVVFMSYLLIWKPLNSQLINSTKQLQRRQALLSWVENKTQQFKQSSLHSKQFSGSITGLVNRSAKQQSIIVTRMQPQGNDIQIWIEEVPFKVLLAWLDQLVTKQGIVIKALDISRADNLGMVQVRRLKLGKR